MLPVDYGHRNDLELVGHMIVRWKNWIGGSHSHMHSGCPKTNQVMRFLLSC